MSLFLAVLLAVCHHVRGMTFVATGDETIRVVAGDATATFRLPVTPPGTWTELGNYFAMEAGTDPTNPSLANCVLRGIPAFYQPFTLSDPPPTPESTLSTDSSLFASSNVGVDQVIYSGSNLGMPPASSGMTFNRVAFPTTLSGSAAPEIARFRLAYQWVTQSIFLPFVGPKYSIGRNTVVYGPKPLQLVDGWNYFNLSTPMQSYNIPMPIVPQLVLEFSHDDMSPSAGGGLFSTLPNTGGSLGMSGRLTSLGALGSLSYDTINLAPGGWPVTTSPRIPWIRLYPTDMWSVYADCTASPSAFTGPNATTWFDYRISGGSADYTSAISRVTVQVDRNECSVNNGGCNTECINTFAGFFCTEPCLTSPTGVTNGVWRADSGDSANCAGQNHTALCTLACNDGYSGSGSVTCDAGTWTGPKPNCAAVPCVVPNVESIGEGVLPGTCATLPPTTGSSCELACAAGYEMEGSAQANCLAGVGPNALFVSQITCRLPNNTNVCDQLGVVHGCDGVTGAVCVVDDPGVTPVPHHCECASPFSYLDTPTTCASKCAVGIDPNPHIEGGCRPGFIGADCCTSIVNQVNVQASLAVPTTELLLNVTNIMDVPPALYEFRFCLFNDTAEAQDDTDCPSECRMTFTRDPIAVLLGQSITLTASLPTAALARECLRKTVDGASFIYLGRIQLGVWFSPTPHVLVTRFNWQTTIRVDAITQAVASIVFLPGGPGDDEGDPVNGVITSDSSLAICSDATCTFERNTAHVQIGDVLWFVLQMQPGVLRYMSLIEVGLYDAQATRLLVLSHTVLGGHSGGSPNAGSNAPHIVFSISIPNDPAVTSTAFVKATAVVGLASAAAQGASVLQQGNEGDEPQHAHEFAAPLPLRRSNAITVAVALARAASHAHPAHDVVLGGTDTGLHGAQVNLTIGAFVSSAHASNSVVPFSLALHALLLSAAAVTAGVCYLF